MGLFGDIPRTGELTLSPRPGNAREAAASASASLTAAERIPLAPDVETTPSGVELLRRARNPPEFTESRQGAFLEALAECPNRPLAALKAGILVSQVDALEKSDPGFAQAVQMAMHGAAGMAEAEAWRRAIQGVERGIYHNGGRIDTEVVYSDGLLTKVLEANLGRYERKSKVEGELTHRHRVDWMSIAAAAREDPGEVADE